jgi:hypothetical protein
MPGCSAAYTAARLPDRHAGAALDRGAVRCLQPAHDGSAARTAAVQQALRRRCCRAAVYAVPRRPAVFAARLHVQGRIAKLSPLTGEMDMRRPLALSAYDVP